MRRPAARASISIRANKARATPRPRTAPRTYMLHFGEILKQCNPAATDGVAIQPCHEEANMWLEQRRQRQPVLLLWRVFRCKNLVEFSDQLA